MKTNINDFRKLSDPDLIIKIKDLRGQLFVLNFQIASGKSNSFSDVKKLKQLKRNTLKRNDMLIPTYVTLSLDITKSNLSI